MGWETVASGYAGVWATENTREALFDAMMRKEVYATTVVVILTSTFFGLYLWGLDLALNAAVNWIFRRFGAA